MNIKLLFKFPHPKYLNLFLQFDHVMIYILAIYFQKRIV